ncbi:MAG: MATE family efflux transporter [Prevotella sp.]|jgi:putative MATE family efflux protein
MERDAIDWGTVNVFSLFKKYFIPTLLGMLSMSAVTAIDGIFVGHGVGSDGIAAVNLNLPAIMLLSGIGLMVGVGCSVVASIHLSREKIKAARLNVTQGLAFASLIALALTTYAFLFPDDVARLLGSSEHLLPMVKDYLLWLAPSWMFQVWASIGLFIIRLDGAPRLAMWCSMISAIINIILDWLFIFPLGWGVKGAAFASTISVVVGGVMAMTYLVFFAKRIRLYPPKMSVKSFRLTIRNLGYQCHIGFSALLGEITLAVLMYCGNIVFMKYLGDDGVGAFGIACYYTPFVFMIGNAIAQSAQPIISYNYGLNLTERLKKTLKIALATAVFCGAVVMLVFVVFPKPLVGLFVNMDSEAARIAVEGFPLFATGFVFFTTNLSAIGYFQSIERVKPSLLFSSLRGCIFLVPSFFLLPQLFGTEGIWLAMPLSELLTCICIVAYYCWNRKSHISAKAA